MPRANAIPTGCAAVLIAVALASCAGRTTGESIDDSTIATSVKTSLLGDEVAPGTSINVESYKGTVQLIGFVGSEAEERAAVEVARSVEHVVDVVDAMVVVPEKRSFGTTVDDQAIQTKVKFNLSEAGAGAAVSVVTDVRNGEVLLGGFVDTAEQRGRIEKIAADVEGVTKVHNFIGTRLERP